MRIKHFLPAVLTLVLFTAAQFAQAASLPEFSELAAKCGPAVVNISAERTSPAAAGPEEFFGEMFRGMPPGADRFFEFFGGPNARGKRPPQKQMSRGSGFIISPDGYIVTNYHVVADGDSIQVTLDESNGKTAPLTATVVGTDEDTDLALLKVEAKKDLPFLKFGDSDALLVGEWLLAIGNPFALDHTVTAGILSAKNRNIHAGPFDNFLQTDASINPGNSGGPLLNMKGEVIGINTAIIASGQGIGFAIPSNMAAGIVEQIKSGKKVSRGWIGVTIQDVDENTAKAGIEAGDVITKVNGKSVEDASALLRAIAAHKPGTSVTLDVWRNGKAVTMDVTLGDRQTGVNSGKPSEAGQKQQNQGQLGLTVRPIKDEERRELKLEGKGGLLVLDVDPSKPAAEAGVRPGDVIVKANRQAVSSPEDLSKIVAGEGSKRGAVMLQINRRGENIFRAVPVSSGK